MTEPYMNTPPAPQDKGAMTAQNIAAAFAGESQASQKYLAFADVADAEGYPNVARLFRAVAFAESTHARNHLSVLGGIGTTGENLRAAWGGETFEIDEMYPAYDAVARMQGTSRRGPASATHSTPRSIIRASTTVRFAVWRVRRTWTARRCASARSAGTR